MGRRILISEEEKKTILSLYESAPPPDESVLVANKNPFNDKELLDLLTRKEYDSLRPYSKDLVDGDFFLVEKKDEIDEYFNLIADELYDNYFRGKNIRYVDKKDNEDHVYTFTDMSRRYGHNYCNMCIRRHYLNTRFKYGVVEISFPKPKIMFDYYSDDFDQTYNSGKILISDDTKNKISKVLMDNKDRFHIRHIPDEYFEIRKIVRKKTDF